MAGPVIDLPTTMAKFLHLGMSIEDVILASTWNPASLIQSKEKLGTLTPGACADITLFKLKRGRFPLMDSSGKSRTVAKIPVPLHVVREGKVVL
jgi:dihydroorotase